MKIVHIVAALEEANGVALTVARLAREQAVMGHAVTIVTSFDDERLSVELANVTVQVFPAATFGSICFSLAFARGIRSACVGADLVHTHSAWTFPVWWGAWCAKRSGAKLLTTPHGAYDPVRRAYHAGRKRLVSWLDRWCLRAADKVHSISEIERKWLVGFEPRIKAFSIYPLAVDAKPLAVDAKPVAMDNSAFDNCRRFLYLGRLHPLKGVDLLVKAWRLSAFAHGRLLVAGPDEQGTLTNLRRLADAAENVEFRGPVYGAEKQELVAQCDVFVLPSLSENFGLVVAEALAAGKPVIVTDVIPWHGVVDHGCGWVAKPTVEGLSETLGLAIRTPHAELAAMGERGHEWMRRDFSWRKCAETLLNGIDVQSWSFTIF